VTAWDSEELWGVVRAWGMEGEGKKGQAPGFRDGDVSGADVVRGGCWSVKNGDCKGGTARQG